MKMNLLRIHFEAIKEIRYLDFHQWNALDHSWSLKLLN